MVIMDQLMGSNLLTRQQGHDSWLRGTYLLSQHFTQWKKHNSEMWNSRGQDRVWQLRSHQHCLGWGVQQKKSRLKGSKEKRWYDRRIKAVWDGLDLYEDRASCPMHDMSLNSVISEQMILYKLQSQSEYFI